MASRDEKMMDIEKRATLQTLETPVESSNEDEGPESLDPVLDGDESLRSDHKLLRWTKWVEHVLGLEARGIHRVRANEQTPKTTLSFLQIVVLWFSINTASQNIILASIGGSVYSLGFVDATLCSVFGTIVGSIPVAYTAGWGPWSGNRTLVYDFVMICEL
jgi:hypothetical protein